MTNWPNQSTPGALDAFYGNPRGAGGGADPAWEAANLTNVAPPWRMTYEGKPVASIRIHKKCADTLASWLNVVWNYYGRDQAKIDEQHLNEFGGSYNFRPNVNDPSRLSLHAYGAAIDIAPNENPNGKAWTADAGMMPMAAVSAARLFGIAWGGLFGGRKDGMHFEWAYSPHEADPLPGGEPNPPVRLSAIVTPSPVPVPVPIDQPAPSVSAQPTANDILFRFTQFVVSQAGLGPEIDAYKARVIAHLQAAIDEVNRFDLATVATTTATPAAPVKPVAPSAPAPRRFTGITTTSFGGAGDTNASAYGGMVNPNSPGVALPARFTGTRPQVRVIDPSSNKSVVCDIVDVGPWNIDDPYWLTPAGRPQAESGTDKHGRHTNLAGLDMTPAAWAAIGRPDEGKAKLDWEFVSLKLPTFLDPSAKKGSVTMPTTSAVVDVKPATSSKINWTQIIALAATLLSYFTGGKLNFTPEQQLMFTTAVGTVAPIVTIIFKTWFTKTVTPQSVK